MTEKKVYLRLIPEKLTVVQEKIWNKHGMTGHSLRCEEAMTLGEIFWDYFTYEVGAMGDLWEPTNLDNSPPLRKYVEDLKKRMGRDLEILEEHGFVRSWLSTCE
jgi:hypothetical protein